MPAREQPMQVNAGWAHEQSLLAREERHATVTRRYETLRIFSLRAVVMGGILGLWWAASGTLIDRLFVSDPISVVTSFVQMSLDGTLWWHLESTLLEMTLGYILGVTVGVALAIIVTLIRGAVRSFGLSCLASLQSQK